MIEVTAAIALVMALAWSNGANDVAKGIATLAGSGVTSARRALFWGSFCTLCGGIAAAWWGAALLKTFGSDFMTAGFQIDLIFVTSALGGASAWVLLATRLGLPVSTTHALLGGIVGGVLSAAGTDGLHTAAVANKALAPLLLSPLLAVALCAAILLLARWIGRRVPSWRPGCCPKEQWQHNPYACATDHPSPLKRITREQLWHGLHWLSSGVTNFARALNDVPKIAAFLLLTITLAPQSAALSDVPTIGWIIAVSIVMTAGSWWGGQRVLDVMAHRVAAIEPASGLAANTGTSLLVLAATPLGLPVSTTHVSTGSLMGLRWTNGSAPTEGDALKMILFGWVVTLPVGAVTAAGLSGVLRTLV